MKNKSIPNMNIHYFSGEAWEEAYVRAKLPG